MEEDNRSKKEIETGGKKEELKETGGIAGMKLDDDILDQVSGGVSLQHIGHTLEM